MMPDQRDALRNIRTFPQLIKFLRDELDWPIESEHFEELTFDYTAEELGIDTANAAKIQEIKRLRPLSVGQPWGIFFVKFEPKRLPVVALRRVLSRVALKKRASANSDERAAWQADDLLFVSNYGEGDERQISFAHFSQDTEKTDLPTLKVLGWDNRDTPLHLDDVADKLSTKLAWPDDDKNTEHWRDTWRSAFTLRHHEVINTSKDLAIRLADLARVIRARIQTVLKIETEKGPVTTLMKAFQEALIHDLTADDFADMYAQTIAYGLLSARVAHPAHDTADALATHIPVTNPFLKELMETFLHLGGRKRKENGGNGIDFDELGVSEVVELLDAANMEAVVRDFGDRNRDEDPVIHFYELFLKEYDAKKRMQRGVFYTPQPVVSYIVRSVHELLQREFGLEDGLASTATWGEMAAKHSGLQIPDGVKSADPFVVILDPATGTATFLVEVIDVIHQTLTAKWKQQGLNQAQQRTAWNEYVPKHLLPRLYGYELMMAPYAIAHMKIGLKLYETGYRFGSDERARIYLTNSLEPPQDFSDQFASMAPALAHEAQAVNAVKKNLYFTITIGNPPYSVSSWNTGAWITNLVEDYKRTVRGEESQIQSLSNDYIKFLRFGEWQIERTGVGILGLITGHGYLLGTQPRDLRRHLSHTFHCCYCLDLHGSLRRSGTHDTEDEPVFQIMTGVAIILAMRTWKHVGHGMTRLVSLTGRLEKKFAFLGEATALETGSETPLHSPTQPYFHFAASETAQNIVEEYRRCLDLPDIFGTGNRQADKEVYWATGFASQQDELAMSFSRAEVKDKMTELANSRKFDELKKAYRLCTTDQWNYKEAKKFAHDGSWREHVGQVAYRPFDRRWTVLHKHVLTILRKQVMSQLNGDTEHNIGLISSRAVNDLTFAHCFVTNEPADKIFISSKTSTNAYVFPLFFHENAGLLGLQCRPNFSRKFLALLARTLGLQQATQDGIPEALKPEDIFNYAYAIFHCPGYRARYAEFLKIDFPRLPLTGHLELFRALARLGSELVALHLLQSPKLDKPITTYTGPANPEVEKISYARDTVWLDKSQMCGFRGVPEDVWNFHIGGYQVCEKWLKDRRGRTLSKDDIAHYHKIVAALRETIRLMKEIDEVTEKHGGWPGAFQSTQDDSQKPGDETLAEARQ